MSKFFTLFLIIVMAAWAQSTVTDPRITSWLTDASGSYARLYESDANKLAGTASLTWSRGAGVQSSPVYAGVTQVQFSANSVYLRTTGLGYHIMGPWYGNVAHTQNFGNFPANQNALFQLPRTPVVPLAKTLTNAGPIGVGVDGVALFDNRDTFSYANSSAQDGNPMNGLRGDGIWNRDAYINEGMTFDPAFAHQAGSNYHYHANTPALRFLLGDHGVKRPANLDPNLAKHPAAGMQLSAADQAALVAFLRTLTDSSFASRASRDAPQIAP